MTSVALMRAAAVWPAFRFMSRAELAVMIEVIGCSPMERTTSAMRPLMRTLAIRPTSWLRPGQPGPKKWFNTSAFQVAPQFTLGNSSRNPVRGPDYHDADLALIKHTLLRERLDLEFRAEFFNVTNTPAFGQPNGVLGSSAFGTITSTASDPRVIQFGVKVNY